MPKQINAWKTVFRCEREREAVLEAVRTQDLSFSFYGETAPAAIRRVGAGPRFRVEEAPLFLK